jgi:hypothetical protein
VTLVQEVKRGERHVYRYVAGEHLLVALQRTRSVPLFSLTESGAELWKQLGDWTTAAALAEHLVGQFDVDLDAAATDVEGFLNQLESIGALEMRERDT